MDQNDFNSLRVNLTADELLDAVLYRGMILEVLVGCGLVGVELRALVPMALHELAQRLSGCGADVGGVPASWSLSRRRSIRSTWSTTRW